MLLTEQIIPLMVLVVVPDGLIVKLTTLNSCLNTSISGASNLTGLSSRKLA